MNDLLMQWKAAVVLLRVGFIMFLAISACQDFRKRCINVNIFVIFGVMGGGLRCIQIVLELGYLRQHVMWQGEDKSRIYNLVVGHLWDIGLAAAIGAGILALSYAAREAIGRGDGWFFVVSGLYLGTLRNLLLLAGGLCLCFIIGLALVVRGRIQGRSVRNMRLPFLPFLIPAGIGVMLL